MANSIVTRYLLDVQPGLVKVLAATTGTDTARYVFDPLGVHAQQDPNGTWKHILRDSLGSARVVANDTVSVDSIEQYAPYGEPLEGGALGTPFGFTGEMTDANGLVYLRARYYAPVLGVFPSLDPVENLNRYQYVGANPINTVDRSGMDQQIDDDRLCPPGMDFIPPASCEYAGGNWPLVSMSEAWSDFWKTYAGEAILGQRTEWWNPFDDLCLGDLALLLFIAEPSPAGELATGYKALRTLGRVLPWLVALGGMVITAIDIDLSDVRGKNNDDEDRADCDPNCVVRAGTAEPPNLIAAYVLHPTANVYGFSVQYQPGIRLSQLARVGFPHKMLSYAKDTEVIAAGLTAGGYRIALIPTPGVGYHTDVTAYDPAGDMLTSLPPELASALSIAFSRKMLNPNRI